MTADRPRIVADPAVAGGRPMVRGTPVDAVAGMLAAGESFDVVAGMLAAGESFDVVADEYNLTRPDMLVACWYLAWHGPIRWRAWTAWADHVAPLLAKGDYDAVPDPPRTEPAPDLTRREEDVLALLGTGHTYAAIGGQMGVSVNTVNSHVRRLYRKLGARDRAQAVAYGYELGLLTVGGER